MWISWSYMCFEILHARWAMLAALGALVPEVLDLVGAFHFVEPVWWRVGYSKLKGDTLNYLGIPGLHLAGSQGVIVIAICQALLMSCSKLFWLPVHCSQSLSSFRLIQVKELKNGRLAIWLPGFRFLCPSSLGR
ncbi:hypothetical protein Leryth_025275 [Lithospermum erythrorhizon]|nr:hypothetical protein Leryth_025275 [Lithospermum erythrorhizon]